jgi:alkaline phosphatase
MVRRSIEFLELHEQGYFLVVDAESINRAAGQNDGQHVLSETVEMDRAIETAIRYAGDKSVIVAAGLQATGGLTLNGYPLRQEHGVGLLGVNAFGYPSIAWATGPNGPQKVTGTSPAPPQPGEPAAFYAPEAIDSAEDVIAIGRGKGTEALKGVMDNTQIFQMLQGGL